MNIRFGNGVTSDNLETRLRITDYNTGYLEARIIAEARNGRLLSNREMDYLFVKTELWREFRRMGVYNYNTDSIVAYPTKNEVLKRGDLLSGNLIVPGSSVPKEAIGKLNMALFFEHPLIEQDGDMWVISPMSTKSVIILDSFIQNSGEMGKEDKITGMPLAISLKEAKRLDDKQRRWLYRFDNYEGFTIGPVVRSVDVLDDRRYVGVGYGIEVALGVAYVQSKIMAKIQE